MTSNEKTQAYETLCKQIEQLILGEKNVTSVLANVASALHLAFPGHIACSSLSRSEIVVPLHQSNGSVWGVIDIDSKMLSAFDSVDAYYLEKLENILRKRLEE